MRHVEIVERSADVCPGTNDYVFPWILTRFVDLGKPTNWAVDGSPRDDVVSRGFYILLN